MLVTENLTKLFDGFKALDGVSMKVDAHSLTLIAGPNGSGKTTLINTICGFYKADGGHIFFNGEEITNLKPHEIRKRGIARTFQIPHPLKRLTVLENLLVAVTEHPGERLLRCMRCSAWERAEADAVEKAFELLEFLELDALWDTEAYKLSGGQLKLLEVGRALMSDAKLIIMDEPLTGVNPKLAHCILEKLVELKKRTTFLIVEHRFDIVAAYVDKVFVMVNGRLADEKSEAFREVIRLLCFK